jgi:hypothetical protein
MAENPIQAKAKKQFFIKFTLVDNNGVNIGKGYLKVNANSLACFTILRT